MKDDAQTCPSCGAPQEVIKPPVITIPKPPDPLIPLFKYNNFGLFILEVYPNRISIVDKRGGTMALAFPKKSDILIRNITGINLKGWGRHVELTLTDGTLREIPIISGKNSEKMREVVLGLL
jgi:hypothetical protein